MRTLAIVAAAVIVTTPTQAQQHPYFPLQKGATWTYRLPSMGAQVVIRKITDANTATHTYTMEEAMHLAVMPVTDKVLYRFKLDAGNVLQLGHAPVPTPLVVTGPPAVILKENLAKGMHWKGCGGATGHTTDADCEVVGFVTVSVPAGEFKNVAQILVGKKGGLVQSYDYYAPNVGLVKIQDLDERAPLMELVSFTPGN
jgi:hypothetical protein